MSPTQTERLDLWLIDNPLLNINYPLFWENSWSKDARKPALDASEGKTISERIQCWSTVHWSCKPQRDRPSLGLDEESIHSHQTRVLKRCNVRWVAWTISWTSSWELVPRTSAATALSLSTHQSTSQLVKASPKWIGTTRRQRDSPGKICWRLGIHRSISLWGTTQVPPWGVSVRPKTTQPRRSMPFSKDASV